MSNAPQKKIATHAVRCVSPKRLASRPELRFPEFKGEWVEKRLGQISTWKSGGTPSKDRHEYWNGDISWISASSMHEYKIDDSEFKISELGLRNGSRLTEQGTLLLLVRGSMLYNRIPVGIAQRDVAFNQDVKAIDAGKETNVFLLSWFQSKENLLLNMVTGTGIGAGKLETDDLQNLKIRLPDFYEQKKIADFLSAVDRRIEGLEKKRELLKEYKKGLMQQLFSQTLRFANGDKPFPKWEEKRLGEVAEIVGGGTPDTSDEKCWGGEIQWFTPTEIKTKYLQKSQRTITETGLKKSSAKLLPVGALLFSSRATIGDVGIALQPCTTNQGFQSFVTCSNASNEFLYYWIASNKKQFLRRSSGSTFLEISKSEIQKLKIQFPCLAEQKKIADCLSALDRKIESVESQVARTREFKRGLLQKMFV